MGIISKIKQLFGMGTVSVKLSAPSAFNVSDSTLSGKITITGKSDQIIESVELEFFEKYTTGRGDNETTKEILLGQAKYAGFSIKKDETKVIDFNLSYQYSKSQNEAMAEKGGVVGGLGKMASFASGEKSTFELVATADVKGASFDPNDVVEIKKSK